MLQKIINQTQQQSQQKIKQIDIDNIIFRLHTNSDIEKFTLKQFEVKGICDKVRKILSHQPMLLELEPPINVCGDIHGQFYDLLKIFHKIGSPQNQSYLFLGDYVDRGKMGLQSICLLLAYKIKYPKNFFLLRGNHQCSNINKIYGFFDQCKQRLSVKIWELLSLIFNYLPVAAIIGNRIFCTHGGISPNLINLSDINKLTRPIQVAKNGVLTDLLWSDPLDNLQGWVENMERGISYNYGKDVLQKFLKKYDFDFMCRSHQVVQDGYEFLWNRKLLTIFSVPNYCGLFDNRGGVLIINQNMVCKIQTINPNPLLIKKRENKNSEKYLLMENLRIKQNKLSPFTTQNNFSLVRVLKSNFNQSKLEKNRKRLSQVIQSKKIIKNIDKFSITQ